MGENIKNESNSVENLKSEIKEFILQIMPQLKDDEFLDIAIIQAIFECMKSIYDEEMIETKKSMEKTFFGVQIDRDKANSYDNNKQKLKRQLKAIEYYRFAEGEKIEKLSGIFPEDLKCLKKSSDKSKSNFDQSNQYNISSQNKKEIECFMQLEIYKKILNKQIVKKNCTNGDFEDYYKKYDDYFIQRINSVLFHDTSPEEYLSVVFDLFNFEDKVSLEWLYSFADYVVENKIPQEKYVRAEYLYKSHITGPSGLMCMNRAPFLKKRFLSIMMTGSDFDYAISTVVYCKILEYILFIKRLKKLSDRLRGISKEEWVKFIKSEYDLLGLFEQNKIWEPKKIKIVRKIIDMWNENIAPANIRL